MHNAMWKIFRQINSLMISLVKTLLSRNFCQKYVLEISGNFCTTLWKNEKFTLTQKIFRQINYLVILLVKPLFWRNFCQKSVRVNFRLFHSVHSVEITEGSYHSDFTWNRIESKLRVMKIANYTNSLSHFFGKNFVKVKFLRTMLGLL